MCSACSAVHQHSSICVFGAELAASKIGQHSCPALKQSERPRDISAEGLKDAAQSR